MTPAPGTSLLETLSRWPSVVRQTLGQREQLKKDLASKEDQLNAAESAHRLALAEKDKAIADATWNRVGSRELAIMRLKRTMHLSFLSSVPSVVQSRPRQ